MTEYIERIEHRRPVGSGVMVPDEFDALRRAIQGVWRIGHGTSEIHRWMVARNLLKD